MAEKDDSITILELPDGDITSESILMASTFSGKYFKAKTEQVIDVVSDSVTELQIAAFKGAWTANTTYKKGDAVTNGGNTYRRKANGVSGASFDSAQWDLTAQGGSVADAAITYPKFDNNLKNYQDRIEKSNVFKGFSIEAAILKFLVDIKFTGLVVADSDVVNVYYAYRNLSVNGVEAPSHIVAIAVNQTRVCQFKTIGYTEPAADAAGHVYALITLDPLSASGVSATALVDWSAITTGTALFYNTEPTKLLSRLSEKVYRGNINRLDISANNIANTAAIAANTTAITANGTSITALNNKAQNLNSSGKIASTNVTDGTASTVSGELLRIDKTGMFKGPEIESFLPNFLLDLRLKGHSVSLTGKVHIYFIYRQQVPSVGQPPKNLLAIAIDDARVCQWEVSSYTEPAADAAGNIFDTLTLTPLFSSGVSGTAVVNWAALSSPLFRQYSTTNISKALIADKVYRPKNATELPVATKANLPTTTNPRRVYSVLNDVDPRNVVPGSPGPLRQDQARQYSIPMYLDRNLRSFGQNKDVRWNETGTDKVMVTSPRKNDNDTAGYDHPSPSTIIAKTLVINGGTEYNNKNVTFDHVSTRESVGQDALVACVTIGDSTVAALNVEVGSVDGFGAAAWSVLQEQYIKCKIDYLLAQGVSVANIQAGNYPGYVNKFRYFSIGTANSETWNLNYRGVTGSYKAAAEGRGSWAYHHYINKPVLTSRGQGPWDAMGLGDGSGTDYIDSAAQKKIFDRSAWNPTACLDTAAMRAWMLSTFGFSATTLTEYKAKMAAQAANPDNPFYDSASVDSVVDSSGDTWQIRFKVAKYLERWRTIDDSGNRLTLGGPTVGTKIVNTASYDVLKPTHIILQLCCNDQSVTHFGQMVKALTDTIKAEYTAQSWGSANIGLAINDSAGTYFTKLYPEVGPFAIMNETLRGVYDDNLARAQASIVNEDTNKIWVLPGTHTTPTARAVIARSANSPEFDLTGEKEFKYFVPSRTSIGILIHPNVVANRVWGINHYAWIKYTLGL